MFFLYLYINIQMPLLQVLGTMLHQYPAHFFAHIESIDDPKPYSADFVKMRGAPHKGRPLMSRDPVIPDCVSYAFSGSGSNMFTTKVPSSARWVMLPSYLSTISSMLR